MRMAELTFTKGRIEVGASTPAPAVKVDAAEPRLAGFVAWVAPGSHSSRLFAPGTTEEDAETVTVQAGELVKVSPTARRTTPQSPAPVATPVPAAPLAPLPAKPAPARSFRGAGPVRPARTRNLRNDPRGDRRSRRARPSRAQSGRPLHRRMERHRRTLCFRCGPRHVRPSAHGSLCRRRRRDGPCRADVGARGVALSRLLRKREHRILPAPWASCRERRWRASPGASETRRRPNLAQLQARGTGTTGLLYDAPRSIPYLRRYART